ncbi:MAG: biopolymer transporter ExbD [Rikenellaceae bacterium]|nr:biopolymer transporter ExbD [Rikenellaceae bacterium]
MAVMSKKGKREVPAMSTSSLPDIVFMLLFFFMAATTMRDTDPQVVVNVPKAHEVSELDKSKTTNVWIGKSEGRNAEGAALSIQFNDAIISESMLETNIKKRMAEKGYTKATEMLVNLRVHETATVGMLTDVKQELRRSEAYNISYAANPYN